MLLRKLLLLLQKQIESHAEAEAQALAAAQEALRGEATALAEAAQARNQPFQ